MRSTTLATRRLHGLLARESDRVSEVLVRYAASNPRVFGSVAHGTAREGSDVDLLVDLTPGGGNELLRVAGLSEELTELLGVKVDVVAEGLLRDEVSATVRADIDESDCLDSEEFDAMTHCVYSTP